MHATNTRILLNSHVNNVMECNYDACVNIRDGEGFIIYIGKNEITIRNHL